MAMRSAGLLLAAMLLVAMLPMWACASDPISKGRSDTGVGPGDGGTGSPLTLTAGMTFTYHAVLKYRDQQANAEEDSQWSLTLKIVSANDQGNRGESTVDFMASGPTTMSQGWTAPIDYDSWVGRLGPSLTTDQVSTTAVTAHLSQAPQIPGPPTPKTLPAPGTFFLDMRQIDAIKSSFAELYRMQMPQVVAPSMNVGNWQLTFVGMDPAIQYYPDRLKTRSIMLEYDPRGFLSHLEETIGDTSMRPNAVCRVDLVSGP